MAKPLVLINKLSLAMFSFYETMGDKEWLLSQVREVEAYFNDHPEVREFFMDYGLKREQKREALSLIFEKFKVDEILQNTLLIMVDRNLSFYIHMFLTNSQSMLYRSLNIQNVHVYSSFDIIPRQRKRLEELWSKKLQKQCIFNYAIDRDLGLGIKIQADTYIEEFSLHSHFSKLKLKLDAIFN